MKTRSLLAAAGLALGVAAVAGNGLFGQVLRVFAVGAVQQVVHSLMVASLDWVFWCVAVLALRNAVAMGSGHSSLGQNESGPPVISFVPQ